MAYNIVYKKSYHKSKKNRFNKTPLVACSAAETFANHGNKQKGKEENKREYYNPGGDGTKKRLLWIQGNIYYYEWEKENENVECKGEKGRQTTSGFPSSYVYC